MSDTTTQPATAAGGGTTDGLDELKAATEYGDGIFCVRNPETHRGWNGIRYKTGMSAKNVGSAKLSMNVATIPPGGVTRRTRYRIRSMGFTVG